MVLDSKNIQMNGKGEMNHIVIIQSMDLSNKQLDQVECEWVQ